LDTSYPILYSKQSWWSSFLRDQNIYCHQSQLACIFIVSSQKYCKSQNRKKNNSTSHPCHQTSNSSPFFLCSFAFCFVS